jgi:5-methylcytosine-specific restriction endonuclease McrA
MSAASDDVEIFVFPAANPTAQANLIKSIENPIQPESVVFDSFQSMSDDLHNELNRIKDIAGGFYAWGAEPRGHAESTWRKMARRDYVLAYYFKGYHYVARVLASFHEPTLATNIWGTNQDTGNTWEYIYFLTEPVKIDVPAYWIADFLNSKEPSWVYQGFSRIAGGNREAILNTCGSVQDFINLLLDYKGDGTPPKFLITSAKSEKLAKTSLETDYIVQGEQLEKLIPDVEGRKRIRQHVTYERSARNRALAIELHGRTCEVCGFNFDEVYGSEHADGYIQIHHVKPVSEYEGEVDLANDLIPLCANCHAMAHRRRDTVTSINKLKALIEKTKS